MALLLWLMLAASGCAMLPPADQVRRLPSVALPASTATPLGELAARSSPAPELSGFRLLPIGSFALATRIALAQRAKASIDLQYYLIENDETGRYLLRCLRDAAQRGVRVRLLIDDLYTAGEDELLLGLAATPNVEIRLFNPFPGGRDGFLSRFMASLLDFGRVNHRMHNKLFIADGAMAVAGGRNIGNEYFMRDGTTNFVDLDTFVTGAVVPRLQWLFDNYWNSTRVFPLHAIVPPPADLQALRDDFEHLTGEPFTPVPSPPPTSDVLGYGPLSDDLDDERLGLIWAHADAFADPPEKIGEGQADAMVYDKSMLVRTNVLQRMREAKQEVVVTSPYFIPGRRGVEFARQLRQKDVRIRVLTNSLAATDEPLVHIGYSRYRRELLAMGVDLHELSPNRIGRSWKLGMFGSTTGRLHAKTAVIDRREVFIGSMNFDPRSEKHNTEMGLLIDSPELARDLLRLVDLDKLQASYRLRLEPRTGKLQWLAVDDDGVRVLEEEPDADAWLQVWLYLLTPLAPEELL
jgi:putative cardiolipin synthase